MKSSVVKRSIIIAGHKTSVSLEDAFWTSLKDLAARRKMSLSSLVAYIDDQKCHDNLSSAIRLFVLNQYQTATNGHANGLDRLQPAQRGMALS